MKRIWSHETFGEFIFDDAYDWEGEGVFPAFPKIRFKRPQKFIFSCKETDSYPSTNAIKMADIIIENQYDLSLKNIEALWLDFNGRGPVTGMWWHGELDEINSFLEEEFSDKEGFKTIGSPEDIWHFMELRKVLIAEDYRGYIPLVGLLEFVSDFEEEHGVGVLTDGVSILGVGYGSDAGLYKNA